MKILIAVDGSTFSKGAVDRIAETMPNAADTEVRIISVYEKLGPMVAEPFGVSNEHYHVAENAAREAGLGIVTDAAEQLRGKFAEPKFTVTTDVIRGGIARVIVEDATEWNADLIVMGSHGHGFWERNLLGSVSDGVIHHAPCSVFVVRPRAA